MTCLPENCCYPGLWEQGREILLVKRATVTNSWILELLHPITLASYFPFISFFLWDLFRSTPLPAGERAPACDPLFPGLDALLSDTPTRPHCAVRLSPSHAAHLVEPFSSLIPTSLSRGFTSYSRWPLLSLQS